MLQRGEVSTLLRWFEALPAELLRSRPRLSLFCAWALFGDLQLDNVEPHLQDTERALQATPDNDMQGEIDTIRAWLIRIQGDAPRAIELYHQALDRTLRTT
jgi:ATP/maltotriose-dependent transcriptional regulator MalT